MIASIFPQLHFFHKCNDEPKKCRRTFLKNEIAYFFYSIPRVTLRKAYNVKHIYFIIGSYKSNVSDVEIMSEIFTSTSLKMA